MIIQHDEDLDGPLNAGSLTARVAVVTGAGSRDGVIGNGSAASVMLSRRGATVVIVDNDPVAAASTARLLERHGGLCSIVVADVSQEADCRDIAEEVAKRWGRFDILVNNVGIRGPAGNAIDVSGDDWDRLMQVNVKSMMLMAKSCLPSMILRRSGTIINVSSTAGIRGGHPDLAYPTSKGAIMSLTQAMAAHHGPQGVRVNCVAPGPVYTPMAIDEGVDERVRTRRRDSVPLRKEGTGWDVGMAVAWLASDEARWVTGMVLPIDGGLTSSRGVSWWSR